MLLKSDDDGNVWQLSNRTNWKLIFSDDPHNLEQAGWERIASDKAAQQGPLPVPWRETISFYKEMQEFLL